MLMEKSARTHLHIACTFFLTAAVATPLAAASPAHWAPKDTALLVEIPDFKEFMAQWKKTVVYRCFQDPQIKKLTEPIAGQIDAKLNELARELGLESIEQLKVEPEGGAAFIMSAPRQTANGRASDPDAAIVADWGGNSPQLKELLDKISANAVERGWRKQAEDFDGTGITSLVPPSPSVQPADAKSAQPIDGEGAAAPANNSPEQPAPPDAPAPKRTLSFATAGTVSVLGSDTQLIKDILSRVKKPTPDCLAGNEHYQTIARDDAPMGQLSLFVDQRRLMQAGIAGDEKKQKQLEASGLENFGPLVATLSLAPASGVAIEMRGSVPLLGEKVGLAKTLIDNVVNKPLHPQGGISQNTVAAWWLNYRFEMLVSDIYEFAKRSDPEGAEVFKSQLKIPISETETIDLEKLFNSLALPLKLHAAMNPPYENKDVSIVLSIGHTSRENVGQLFTIPTMTQFCQKRDVMGQSVYDLVFPPVGASLGLTDQFLAVGNTSGINSLVESGSSAQNAAGPADPQFLFAVAGAPQEAAQGFYLNLHTLFKAALALHRQAKAVQQASPEAQPSFGMDMTTKLRESLQKIPFDQVEKPEELLQFAPTILSVTTSQPTGLRFYMNVTEPVKP